jgi:uncharacterized OB-fold protein
MANPVLPFSVLPEVGPDNEFFWTAGRAGQLRFLRCQACGYYIHPPSPRCPQCLSDDVSPEVVSGRATLFSYTINHQQWIPVSQLYVIEEQPGLRLTTNIVGYHPDEIEIGMPLAVCFEQQENAWLPLFRPAPSDHVEGSGT